MADQIRNVIARWISDPVMMRRLMAIALIGLAVKNIYISGGGGAG